MAKAWAATLFAFLPLVACCGAEGIDIWPENRFYWSYKGRPVLLLGGSDEDNLFNHPELMMRDLEALAECGGNYIRCTLSCRNEGNVWPYEEVDGKYDLCKFNPEFWGRLERCLEEALKRDIIVQIEIWATFDFYRENWLRNPFNPAANVNYTTKDTKLVERWDFHPAARPQPFFFSPVNGDKVLLKYQEAFVRKVLDVSLKYPNVLYCLDNETRAPAEWALHWGRFVKEEAERRDKKVHVTEMWDPWDLRDRMHATTYGHPEVFSFVEVSQNNWMAGETHYRRLLWMREKLAQLGPRPMNNVKIYGAPRPRQKADPRLNVDRFWKCIFAGCASARFHRPPTGIGLDELARKTILAARNFTSSFDIFRTKPALDVLLDRGEDEAYCLAKRGEVYALYFPKGGSVKLRAEPEGASWRVRWFDLERAGFVKGEEVKGSEIPLRTPTEGKIWLALVERAR